MDWKHLSDGAYWLEVGKQQYRITLVPSGEAEGTCTGKAALAPDYAWQTRLTNVPLFWTQQHAETKAKLLAAGENKHALVNSTAFWRGKPASLKQLRTLCNLGVRHAAGGPWI